MFVDVIFFFKQKTAYEMRISDWSSDVCSSDLGAIGAFLILIAPQRLREWPGGLQIAARSLDPFSRVGTICVLVIAATGLINSQLIVGPENLGRSLSSHSGQLLLAKLDLFALLLALAAANRWLLTPALAAASGEHAESGDSDPTAAAA